MSDYIPVSIIASRPERSRRSLTAKAKHPIFIYKIASSLTVVRTSQ